MSSSSACAAYRWPIGPSACDLVLRTFAASLICVSSRQIPLLSTPGCCSNNGIAQAERFRSVSLCTDLVRDMESEFGRPPLRISAHGPAPYASNQSLTSFGPTLFGPTARLSDLHDAIVAAVPIFS